MNLTKLITEAIEQKDAVKALVEDLLRSSTLPISDFIQKYYHLVSSGEPLDAVTARYRAKGFGWDRILIHDIMSKVNEQLTSDFRTPINWEFLENDTVVFTVPKDAVDKLVNFKNKDFITLYHLTKRSNLPTIQKEGLIPKGANMERGFKYEPRIHLFGRALTPENIAQYSKILQNTAGAHLSGQYPNNEPMVLLQVTVPKNEYQFFKDNMWGVGKDYPVYTRQPIPPNYIKTIG